VLRPGGVIGVCTPDWGGFILTPPSDALTAAVAAYQELHRGNGGDPLAGRRSACTSPRLVSTTYASTPATSATCEPSGSLTTGRQLDEAEKTGTPRSLRCWLPTPSECSPKAGSAPPRSAELTDAIWASAGAFRGTLQPEHRVPRPRGLWGWPSRAASPCRPDGRAVDGVTRIGEPAAHLLDVCSRSCRQPAAGAAVAGRSS